MILTITVTKASDGIREYVQVMSEDMFTVNVVFLVDAIVVDDRRSPKEEPDYIVPQTTGGQS